MSKKTDTPDVAPTPTVEPEAPLSTFTPLTQPVTSKPALKPGQRLTMRGNIIEVM